MSVLELRYVHVQDLLDMVGELLLFGDESECESGKGIPVSGTDALTRRAESPAIPGYYSAPA